MCCRFLVLICLLLLQPMPLLFILVFVFFEASGFYGVGCSVGAKCIMQKSLFVPLGRIEPVLLH